MSNVSGSMGSTHLVAYVSDGDSAAAIRTLMQHRNINDFIVQPGNAADAAEYFKAHASPQILVVEISSADAAPKQLDALADAIHPSTKVIVTGKVDAFSFYHWLMGLGIQDYLLSPFNESQLDAAINKSQGTAAKSGDEPKQPKKMIAVIGTRGGVGATMVATNLAHIFASEHHVGTALVDLDTHFGSVALSLDLEPSRGLRDALEKPDRVDSLFLERVMIRPTANLAVLSAEEGLSELINASPAAGDALLTALREKSPLIVVDVPRQITPLTRHMLAHADHVLVVADPGLLSLRDALRLKDFVVDTLKRPAPMLIINREGLAAKQELAKGDFTKHLGSAPMLHIPYNAEAIAATARGEIMAASPKTANIIEPLRRLASQLNEHHDAEQAPIAPAKASKLGGIFKGKK
jgi:pilus assembly protein CpaE